MPRGLRGNAIRAAKAAKKAWNQFNLILLKLEQADGPVDLCKLARELNVSPNFVFRVAVGLVRRKGNAVIRYENLPGLITSDGLEGVEL